MVRCAVQGCKNYQGKKDDDKGVRFFCFPKNEEIAQEWLHACGEGTQVNHNIARVCSQHFGEDDWKLQDVLLKIPIHKRKLKIGAVPSINLPGNRELTKGEERIRLKEQKELVEEAISTYNRKYVMEIANHFNEPEMDTQPYAQKSERVTVLQEDPLAAPGPEVESLKKENRALRLHINKLKKRFQQAENAISSMEQIFSRRQIKRVMNPSKRYKWSYDEISSAALLHSVGPTGYAQLVKKNYPFPSTVTIKKWEAKLKLKPGILNSVLKTISDCRSDETDRLCILSLHEFALKSMKPDGNPSRNEFYKSAQAFIACGLVTNWKQVIYYNYDCVKIQEVLLDVIRALREANFTVVAVVSGVGPAKLPLWVEMEVDKDRPFVEVAEGEKVFFFVNIPHLIKNFRNHFVESGFVVKGKLINVEPVEELLSPDMPDLELNFKLTEAHISAKKISRQNVKLAWQLLSQSVANALRRCVSVGKIYSQNAIDCSDLIQLFSDWLDVFNAKCTGEQGEEGSLAYGLDLGEQNATIASMNELISSMGHTKCKTLLPFQKGILQNNAALVQLRSYLEQRHGVKYVITNCFNQDDLENSLRIRRPNNSLGGQPTALEFKYRIYAAVLNNLNVVNV